MSLDRRQQKETNLWKSVKSWHRNENHPKNLFRSRFLPILTWFWSPQATSKSPKMAKNASRKNSKKIEGKKHKKNWKTFKPIGPAECAGRGEDKGGEKKTSKTTKNDAKNWRQKLNQKIEGKGRLEEEDKMLKRLNLGDGLARRTWGRRTATAISADAYFLDWKQ